MFGYVGKVGNFGFIFPNFLELKLGMGPANIRELIHPRVHQHIGARAATSPAGRCREDLRLLDRTHVRIVEDQPAAIIARLLDPLRCLRSVRLRPR